MKHAGWPGGDIVIQLHGVGAWQVATAAEGVERDGADCGVALDRLARAVALVRADIAILLAG